MEHGNDEQKEILSPKEREARNADQAAKMADAEISEQQTEQEDIVGADEGAERVLVHMLLDPRLPQNRKRMANLSKDQIREQLREVLEKHCTDIGWWPDGEGPDFVVARREDGVWTAYAKCSQSTYNKRKDWSEFPRMAVDGRTSEDVRKNRSTTQFG